MTTPPEDDSLRANIAHLRRQRTYKRGLVTKVQSKFKSLVDSHLDDWDPITIATLQMNFLQQSLHMSVFNRRSMNSFSTTPLRMISNKPSQTNTTIFIPAFASTFNVLNYSKHCGTTATVSWTTWNALQPQLTRPRLASAPNSTSSRPTADLSSTLHRLYTLTQLLRKESKLYVKPSMTSPRSPPPPRPLQLHLLLRRPPPGILTRTVQGWLPSTLTSLSSRVTRSNGKPLSLASCLSSNIVLRVSVRPTSLQL